ncbi:MAG TPA: hypothetical protein VK772_14125 [Puia sp.]|jgi:hypothetical protein|nr:hypothetical protein [Puia sp.]
MNKLFFPILIVIIFTLTFSCSKSNNSSGGPTSSEWIYNDTTYKGYTTAYDSAGFPVIISEDSLGNKIYVYFTTPPNVNTQYVVVNNWLDSLNRGNYATILIDLPNKNYGYKSTGKAGDIITTTFLDNKLHVTFSNSSINSIVGNATISGTLIQTIP